MMEDDQELSYRCGRGVRRCVSGHCRWVCQVGVSMLIKSKVFKTVLIFMKDDQEPSSKKSKLSKKSKES